MYFCEKDLGTFYVSIYYTSMTSKKVPKSSNENCCKIYDDICSTNNNNHCIEIVTEIQNTSNEVILTSNKVPKSSNLFLCEKCNFTCSRESQYKRHLSTGKTPKYFQYFQ